VENIANLVRNDEAWANVPTRWRQHAVAVHFDRLRQVHSPDAESIEQMIGHLNAMHDRYPESIMWDDFKRALVIELTNLQHPDLALEFGRSLRTTAAQQTMVVFFLERGHEQEALRLTDVMTDYDVLAQTLIHAEWTEARGLYRLFEIVNDPNELIDKRLTLARRVRDRVAELGEDTARYDDAVTLLETERDLGPIDKGL